MKNRNPLPDSEPCGVLILNKPSGVTSHDMVNRIRRLFGTRRVGHTGTLDPMATGVLVILVGRAAKASEYLASDRKRYTATLRLGLTTDSEDTTGEVLTTSDTLPTPSEVESALDAFRGEILQIPPMYSALKMNGKKLVDLARQGIVVERQARPITIHSLAIKPTDSPSDYTLDVDCSGGTYIRTLCADIGAALGCGGVMASLTRTEACGFSIEEAHTPDALEQMEQSERLSQLIPTERLFADLSSARLPAFYERLFRSGCAIALPKLKIDHPIHTRLRVCSEDGAFFALGEVVEDEGHLALRSIKLFSLE